MDILAFARIGENFYDVSTATANELEKADSRAWERQGRLQVILRSTAKRTRTWNRHLRSLDKLVDRGFREFVENEKKRYAVANAGRF